MHAYLIVNRWPLPNQHSVLIITLSISYVILRKTGCNLQIAAGNHGLGRGPGAGGRGPGAGGRGPGAGGRGPGAGGRGPGARGLGPGSGGRGPGGAYGSLLVVPPLLYKPHTLLSELALLRSTNDAYLNQAVVSLDSNAAVVSSVGHVCRCVAA